MEHAHQQAAAARVSAPSYLRPSMVLLQSHQLAGSVSSSGAATPSTPKSSGRFAALESADGAAAPSGPPRSFMEAAQRGDTAFLIKAIERTLEFNVNQTDMRTGRTALHWAAEAGHLEAAQTLLSFGCELAAKECMGRTAVHLAARAAGAEMLSALLDSQHPQHNGQQHNGQHQQEQDEQGQQSAALINCPDKLGITPVFLAYQRGDEPAGVAAFDWLLAHGARFNQQDLEAQAAAAAAGGASGGAFGGGSSSFGGSSFGDGMLGRCLATASGAGAGSSLAG